jgi:predicted RNA-binding Zn-ribbon protein involved in translation (DUF1610 family)
MECPNCQHLQITKTEKNYISIKPRDGHVAIGHQLTGFQLVYQCDSCGFIWPREPDVLI